jgi:hypothetical protein
MFFRNTKDLISIEGIEVEAGSLWKKNKEEMLVLVDADQYVSSHLDEDFTTA